jgi:hypothetical protein
MISKREEAKLLRERLISEKDQQLSVEEDDYDHFLSNLNQTQLEELFHQSNQARQSGKYFKVPSLTSLCSEFLAKHIDQVEATGDLSVEIKTELAMHLSKFRKLTSPNLLLIINGTRGQEVQTDLMTHSIGMSCLILHDCSSIDEDTMIKAICNANGLFATNLTTPNPSQSIVGSEFEPSLKSLILKNCGHSFTSWMVSRLNYYGVLRNLEYLTLAGLYRLSDQSISDFFSGLRYPSSNSCNRLRGVDLSYSMSLNSIGLTSILNTCPHLTTLILDNTHLDQSSLLLLCARQYDIPHLTELSLSGVTSLTDSILAFLLSADSTHLGGEVLDQEVEIPSCPPPTSSVMKPLGQRLKLLNLKACHLLSDGCFIAIRSFCSEIMNLNISSIKSFTSPVNLLGLFVSQVLHRTSPSRSSSSRFTLFVEFDPFGEFFAPSLPSSLNRLKSSTFISVWTLKLRHG